MNDHELNRYAAMCAAEIIDNTIRPRMADNGGELGDYLGEAIEPAHQSADGSEHVIYYYKAHAICQNCNTDAGREFLEDCSPFLKPDYNDLATKIAYGELVHRIEKAVMALIEGGRMMITYNITTTNGLQLRKGHPVTIDQTSGPITLALHKVKGGYAVDHVATGLNIQALEMVVRRGRPVTFKEAKSDLLYAIEQGGLANRIAVAVGVHAAINPTYTQGATA